MEKLKAFFKSLNPLTLLTKLWGYIKENPGFWFSLLLITLLALLLGEFDIKILLLADLSFLAGWHKFLKPLDNWDSFNDD